MSQESLTRLVEEHLEIARSASSGRSAHTVYGGQGRALHQTLIALRGGEQLHEHENPGDATVHVLSGQVALVAGEDRVEGSAGDLLVVPDARHSLEALSDAVVLLSVGQRPGG